MVIPTPEANVRPPRILIVDDEPKNRKLLEAMLAPEGFLFLTAASGAEALAILPGQAPDLILLDVMMPGVDGYQVAAQIKARADTTHIAIVLLSALNDQNSRTHGMNVGADAFVTKPVDRAELCARVSTLLAARRPRSEK
jgi:CheY-like chemotaxis protein